MNKQQKLARQYPNRSDSLLEKVYRVKIDTTLCSDICSKISATAHHQTS